MSKKSAKLNKKRRIETKKSWTKVQLFSFFILIGYLCCEFIVTDKKYNDIVNPQWFYLSIVNLISSIYFLINVKIIQPIFTKWRRNKVTLFFSLFIVISALSIIQAINIFQGFIVLSRNITTFFIFMNSAFLLYQLRNKTNVVAGIILFILSYQSLDIVYRFLSNIGTLNLDANILSLVGVYGNKNVTAVGLLIKLPFILYLIDHYRKGIWHLLGLLVFAITVFDILLLNARASFIGFGLMILVLVILSLLYYFKIEKDRVLISNIYKIIGIVILTIFINTLLFHNLKQSDDNKSYRYGSLTERISTINTAHSSRRLEIWGQTLKLFKDNWALGCGLGNYQIAILKYENETRAGWAVSKHPHNDFLETASESGIFGLISYAFIYLFVFINFIRIIRYSNEVKFKKLSVVAFMGLSIYFVDAMFNFPNERAPVQLYLGIILALIVISYVKRDEQEINLINNKKIQLSFLPLIFVLMGSIYINFLVVKTTIALKYARLYYALKDGEYIKGKEKINSDEIISLFPDLPTIDEGTRPIACVKASLLKKEKRYAEALEILKDAKKANPYCISDDFLKMEIFFKIEQYDSAMYYADKGLQSMPNYSEFFFYIKEISAKSNNQEGLTIFRNYLKIHPRNTTAWITYSELSQIFSKDFINSIEILDTATVYLGKNKRLLDKKYEYISQMSDLSKKSDYLLAILKSDSTDFRVYRELGAIDFLNQNFDESMNHYKKAIQLNKNDYISLENLGILAYKKQDYLNSINYLTIVINSNTFETGRAELIRGMCYWELNDKEKACADFKRSANKNNEQAIQNLQFCE